MMLMMASVTCYADRRNYVYVEHQHGLLVLSADVVDALCVARRVSSLYIYVCNLNSFICDAQSFALANFALALKQRGASRPSASVPYFIRFIRCSVSCSAIHRERVVGGSQRCRRNRQSASRELCRLAVSLCVK